MSSSEEVEVMSVEGGMDSPPCSTAYEELLEVITRAADRLSIDWPAKSKDVRPKSKLDEHFLKARVQPPLSDLPFF